MATAFFLLRNHLNDARQVISLLYGAMITGTLTREIPRDISHRRFPKFRTPNTGTENIDEWYYKMELVYNYLQVLTCLLFTALWNRIEMVEL